MSMYDFIIFDLDGTLSDSIVGITRSINYSLSHHGYGEHSITKLLKYMGPPIVSNIFSPYGLIRPGPYQQPGHHV